MIDRFIAASTRRAARFGNMFWKVMDRDKATVGEAFAVAFMFLKQCRVMMSGSPEKRARWNRMLENMLVDLRRDEPGPNGKADADRARGGDGG